jgi:hypothetical protein
MNREISVLYASAGAGALALALAACGGSSSPAPTAQSSAPAPASSAPSTGIPVVTVGHPSTFTFTYFDANTSSTRTVVETYKLNSVKVTTAYQGSGGAFSGSLAPGYQWLILNMTVHNASQYQISSVPGFDQWISDGSTTPAGGNGPVQTVAALDSTSAAGPPQPHPLDIISILYPGQSATGDVVYRVPASPGFLEMIADPSNGGMGGGYQVNQFGSVSSVLVELKY